MIADGCRGAGGKKLTGRSGRWGLAQSLATPPSSAHSPSQASRPSWGALLLLCLDPRLQDHPQGPSPSWRGQGKPQGRGCIPECLHTHGPSLPSPSSPHPPWPAPGPGPCCRLHTRRCSHRCGVCVSRRPAERAQDLLGPGSPRGWEAPREEGRVELVTVSSSKALTTGAQKRPHGQMASDQTLKSKPVHSEAETGHLHHRRCFGPVTAQSQFYYQKANSQH